MTHPVGPATDYANTQDWVRATRDLSILAYVESAPCRLAEGGLFDFDQEENLVSTETQETSREPAFGTNIREAIQIIREWRSPSRG